MSEQELVDITGRLRSPAATPRHRDTATPRHRDTATPGHRGTGAPGHRGTGAPGHRGTGAPGHWASGWLELPVRCLSCCRSCGPPCTRVGTSGGIVSASVSPSGMSSLLSRRSSGLSTGYPPNPTRCARTAGVVREAALAPVVEVADLAGADLGRDDQVVKPVATAPSTPLPADLAQFQALGVAKRVSESDRFEPLDQRELGLVPSLAAIGPQSAVAVARERP